MTGPEHYRRAEELLGGRHNGTTGARTAEEAIALAQVHATLALAAAQATVVVPPGPCPVMSQRVMLGHSVIREPVFCDLLAGHAGLHVAGTSVWGEGIE